MKAYVDGLAEGVCDVHYLKCGSFHPLPEDVEAVALYSEEAVVFFPMPTYRLKEVARHEILGHMSPRKALGQAAHIQWLWSVTRRMAGTKLWLEIEGLYGVDSPQTVADEVVARIAETDLNWRDKIAAMFGSKESQIRIEIHDLHNVARVTDWGQEFKYNRGYTRLVRENYEIFREEKQKR
jgi:hypothetical protein